MTREEKDSDLKAMLEKAAEFVIKTGAQETTTGHYYIYAEDIPTDIISPELFNQNINGIVGILEEYEAIGDLEILPDGTIDMIVYLEYCPNYEPDADERDDYPDDREILDPLKSRKIPVKAEPMPIGAPVKLSLVERLEEGKRRAAQQELPDHTSMLRKQEARV